jgi:hypothetical protein
MFAEALAPGWLTGILCVYWMGWWLVGLADYHLYQPDRSISNHDRKWSLAPHASIGGAVLTKATGTIGTRRQGSLPDTLLRFFLRSLRLDMSKRGNLWVITPKKRCSELASSNSRDLLASLIGEGYFRSVIWLETCRSSSHCGAQNIARKSPNVSKSREDASLW